MGFAEDCLKFFGTKNLYEVYQIKKDAKNTQIKKAYYKQSILWHPDRFSSSNDEKEKSLATQKFQIVSKVYNILNDSEKRKIYDSTGSCSDDDFNNVNWADVWRQMFKKVTQEDIEKYLREFRGSKKEMEDVKAAYVKYKGDLDKIFATVIGADVENEDRIREILRYYIDKGEVENFPKFSNEPLAKRAKRRAKAARESVEAKKALSDIQKKENLIGGDLVALIQNRQAKYKGFISNLEEKYSAKPKNLKKSNTVINKSTEKSTKRKSSLENDDNEISQSVPLNNSSSSRLSIKKVSKRSKVIEF